MLVKEEYEAKQKTHGGNAKTAHRSDGRFTASPPKGDSRLMKKPTKTRDILAAEHNVSPRYIDDAVAFGRGLDRSQEPHPVCPDGTGAETQAAHCGGCSRQGRRRRVDDGEISTLKWQVPKMGTWQNRVEPSILSQKNSELVLLPSRATPSLQPGWMS